MADNMEFTGERFVPEVHGDIELEHIHRYLMAKGMVKGKVVLDIASGEGYGSAILADEAAMVYGVDISLEAINHANNRYQKNNLNYKVGSCADIPLSDNFVDVVVVSFETIEHHDQHDEMLKEVKRVLKPSGCIIISSPDKLYFSDEPGFHNEFHVKELYKFEFNELMSKYFTYIEYFAQRIIYGSGIFSETIKSTINTIVRENNNYRDIQGIAKPLYWIAVASDINTSEVSASFLEQDVNDSQVIQHWRNKLAEVENNAVAKLAEVQNNALAKLAEVENTAASKLAEKDNITASLINTTSVIAQKLNENNSYKYELINQLCRIANEKNDLVYSIFNLRNKNSIIEREINESTNIIDRLKYEKNDLLHRNNELINSTSWKLTKPLRKLKLLLKFKGNKKVKKQLNIEDAEKIVNEQSQSIDYGDFCPDVYLARYPDVASSGIDPYYHYITFGKEEGRFGNILDIESFGMTRSINSTKKTIIIVSHEGTRTGAPILGFNLAKRLSIEYNIIAIFLHPGSIVDSLRLIGACVIELYRFTDVDNLYDMVIKYLKKETAISFAIVNSIASRYILPTLYYYKIPTITLIHEFSVNTWPHSAMREAIWWSGRCIFSTKITLDDMLSANKDIIDYDIPIIPQGRCDLPFNGTIDQYNSDHIKNILDNKNDSNENNKHHFVVVGIGTITFRKGIDLFIECAAHVKRKAPEVPIKFIWVGKESGSDMDIEYSAFLSDQIRRSNLESIVSFIGEVSLLKPIYDAADMLIVSSRLDPLPNVAIDAICNGLPVLCFSGATGLAEILEHNGLFDTCVATYLDTVDMANKVIKLSESNELRESVSKISRVIAAEVFDMDIYITKILSIAKEECKRSIQEQEDVNTIRESNLLNIEFYLAPHQKDMDVGQAIQMFIRSWATGIERRKPFPSFHPGIYIEKHGLSDKYINPFADYIKSGMPEGPWKLELITESEPPKVLSGGNRVGLHIHVHYLDIFEDILQRLKVNQVTPDLLISVTSDEAFDYIQRKLDEDGRYVFDIRKVPNIGRDIGSFLTEFNTKIMNEYDIIGHVHTKKSLHCESEKIGRNWYVFLMENLLGGEINMMADIILGHMESNPKIGMVYPDDPHIIGWDQNKVYIEEYADKLGIKDIPHYINFPVGTMFWASTKALQSIFRLNIQWNEYPTEPAPIDGTLLHGLERFFVLPVIKNGYTIANTYIKGVTR